ncbi:DUF2269 family protein [Blastopirellula sp. JC732]|uniref:DUF2269 family protein n=1 Tax=Blastopirellula sediminis TaxID=2894196 RepID=A0A9X1MLW4_9BACT|nr:DUF2269 family protein [Blastopirellula sediminis]MCC9609752.1 DUF2269 family protein [Blastopirellula sediminis]MCC9628996.1 DUF2269 family protein [Blastopirellula sediminis]
MTFAIDLLLRWAHIVPATIMVGGAVYARYALAPSTDPLADEQKELLKAGVRARWMKWVMICAFLLLVSGIINVVLIATEYDFPQKYYHPVVGVKMLAAMVVFYIASMLTGRSENAARFREKERFWLSLNAGLAISIVLMGGALKIAERVPKGEAEAAQPEQSDAPSPSAVENGS